VLLRSITIPLPQRMQQLHAHAAAHTVYAGMPLLIMASLAVAAKLHAVEAQLMALRVCENSIQQATACFLLKICGP
jgi:hypothetical protein